MSLDEELRQQQRNAWLRRNRKAPLLRRFEQVLGPEGRQLRDELKEAYAQAEGGTDEVFDRYARMVLRACSIIPSDASGMDRRRKYVRKCISKLNSSFIHLDVDELPDYEPTNRELLAQIASKGKVSTSKVWVCAFSLCDLLTKRWPDDEERAFSRLHHILINAAGVQFPYRYLQAVLRNENEGIDPRKVQR